MELTAILENIDQEAKVLNGEGLKPFKPWMPKRVVFTADAIEQPYAQRIYERVTALGLQPEVLKTNRITGLRGETERETYKIAKNTLAIVNAPKSAFTIANVFLAIL